MLPKSISRFNAMPIKIPSTLFTEIGKISLTFIWIHKRPPISKAMLRKQYEAGDITIPDFKLYYKVMVIKMVWYRHKNKHAGEQNRIKSPQIKPHTYTQQTVDKWAKKTQWRKESLHNNWWWDNWVTTCRNDWTPILHHSKKLSQKQLDLNVRPKTVKVLEEN